MRRTAGDVAWRRCFTHAGREAVARCPECGRFFCRECVTEHEERVVCASCLAQLSRRSGVRGGSFHWLRGLTLACGVLLAWFVFYALGHTLVSLPDSFHEGTFWGTGRHSSE